MPQYNPDTGLVESTDAERYRWLRTHFRWANDSMSELWFYYGIEADEEQAKELDRTINESIEKTKRLSNL